MEYGFVITWAKGYVMYAEMVEEYNRKRPIFTGNWNESRIYESYSEAEQVRSWLGSWDARQCIRMKDWTKIDSCFSIVRIKLNDHMKNIKYEKKR